MGRCCGTASAWRNGFNLPRRPRQRSRQEQICRRHGKNREPERAPATLNARRVREAARRYVVDIPPSCCGLPPTSSCSRPHFWPGRRNKGDQLAKWHLLRKACHGYSTGNSNPAAPSGSLPGPPRRPNANIGNRNRGAHGCDRRPVRGGCGGGDHHYVKSATRADKPSLSSFRRGREAARAGITTGAAYWIPGSRVSPALRSAQPIFRAYSRLEPPSPKIPCVRSRISTT